MSGHSKWSKVKHQKGITDIKKGQLFTKIANAITIAVRQGGGITDPEANFRLRLAIEKAREINMPKENVQRAIERGVKKGKTVDLEEVTYEGYGPQGVALLIKATTDNRQRTTQAIKNILDSYGGNLASPGSVIYNFKSRGLIAVKKGDFSEDELLERIIEAGASDFEETGDIFLVYTLPETLLTTKEKLAKLGLEVSSYEISLEPQNLVPITEKEAAEKVVNLIKKLEELDDVLKVYANFDTSDDILKRLSL